MIVRKHERWVAELRNQLRLDGRLTTFGREMTPEAAVSEVVDWASDARAYSSFQKYDWQSLAADFERTFMVIGANLKSAVQAQLAPVVADLKAMTDLVAVRKSSLADILSAKEMLRVSAQALWSVLESDSAFEAAWDDLVAAAKDISTSASTFGFLRDVVWAVADRRNLPCGSHSFGRKLGSILGDNAFTVARAQAQLGDQPSVDVHSFDHDADSGLSADERVALCRRVLVAPAEMAHCVVWLRFDNACLPEQELAYGQVTFYWGTWLAAHVGASPWWEHNANFSVVPVEMIKPMEYRFGFDREEVPDVEDSTTVTYARVDLGLFATDRAEEAARNLVRDIIEANHPIDDGWKMFHSSILVKNGNRYQGWGHDYSRSHYMKANDDMGTSLMSMSSLSHTIAPDSSPMLRSALSMRADLNRARKDDPVVRVMASVRAIEHANAWSNGGQDQWFDFASTFLAHRYARIHAVDALGHVVHQALHDVPDPRPGHGHSAERQLRRIREELTRHVWPAREETNRQKAINYLPQLADLFVDHPLGRMLREMNTAFSSGTAAEKFLQDVVTDFAILLSRLRRQRNCAIHGGPSSFGASESVARFAFDLGHQAVNAIIDAVLENRPVSDHFGDMRDDARLRFDDVGIRGDLARLFVPSPGPPVPPNRC
ncbi:hypothetical protein HQO42_15380 [Rhodococcus fascians]|nr:hypothetical protein [Rhodococcus fascians]MBY4238066.1 hypothetical protein [Rhodococcus fascians]MBY4254041.1 hypothetical protein [Rhodococcus fascians]MBY4269575.1 hypothetical protein [Rhodococcus fascians]